jgi:hypothetical protein
MSEIYVSTDVEADGPIPGVNSMLSFGSAAYTPAGDVMPRYVEWLEALPGLPVFIGYPAAYDFLFVYWYLIRFVGRSPFSYSALDIKTFAMALLGTDYRKATKRHMPKRWFDALPHTHRALDDAIAAGGALLQHAA